MEAQPGQIKDSQEQSEAGEATKKKRGEAPPQQIRKAKKATRRRFSAEEKIRIVMAGIRAEEPVSVLCRREGIHTTVYYRWLKDFLEARVLVKRWRRHYNTVRPHSSLDYRPPAPEAIHPWLRHMGAAPGSHAIARGWPNIRGGTTYAGRSRHPSPGRDSPIGEEARVHQRVQCS